MRRQAFLWMQGLVISPHNQPAAPTPAPTGAIATMPDYIPVNDSETGTWLSNFLDVVNANLATWGLVAGDVTPLSDAVAAYNTAVADQQTADAAFRAAVQAKKTARGGVAAILRPFVRRIDNHPGMTNALRALLQITVPKGTRTRKQVGPEIPGMVLELKPGQVVIHFGTDAGNENANGKPAWSLGCNIYRKKASESEYALIAFDTASPYVDTITGPAINVSYKAAYRGTRETDIGGMCPEQTVAAGS
jgi:hypothetical protein